MRRLLIALLMCCSTLSIAQNENTIDLPIGWSLFGFNCQEQIDVATAFSPIIDSVIIVKDYLGFVYLPAFEINTIVSMEKAIK